MEDGAWSIYKRVPCWQAIIDVSSGFPIHRPARALGLLADSPAWRTLYLPEPLG